MDEMNKSHRFDSLAGPSSDVQAEHAMAPPLALSRQSVNPDYIAQRGLHGPPLEMDPI